MLGLKLTENVLTLRGKSQGPYKTLGVQYQYQYLSHIHTQTHTAGSAAAVRLYQTDGLPLLRFLKQI